MRVNEAYGGDLAAAAKDDDAAVAAWVRAYELSIGLEPRDWVAIGRRNGAMNLTRRSRSAALPGTSRRPPAENSSDPYDKQQPPPVPR